MKYSLFLWVFMFGKVMAQVNQVDAKGLKQGLWYKDFPGTKIHMYEGVFKDDKPVGVFKYRYESGSIKAIVDNKPNSKLSMVKMYFENEALMSEGCYWDQKKDSIWVNYNERGELVSAESYVDDKLNGKKIIYYLNDQQKQKADQYKAALDKSGAWEQPIVTTIEPFKNYYPAEKYHQNYYNDNTNQGYCRFVIAPKLEKFEKVFKEKLKKH